MRNSTCPCCSDTLLRHINSKGIYWYCCHCRQEMPSLSDRFSSKTQKLEIKQPSLANMLNKSNPLKVACAV